MDWWLIIIIFLGALIALMFLRIPVFLSFIVICIVGSYLLFNGEKGLYLLITSLTGLTTIYGIVVLPMFVMMGEVLFQSGVALKGLNTIDQLFGKLPGRLAVVTVIAGVVFGALSGSSIGNAAMLGTTLTPDMEQRKYSKSLRLGSVMGAGALAAIIPPSGMAVLIASIGEVSVGKLLISGILPGIFLASLYLTYIITGSILKPDWAPRYKSGAATSWQKAASFVSNLLPLFIIIVTVLGSIFMGIATPTEAAAVGVLASYLLVISYKKFNWGLLKKVTIGTTRVTAMILIVVGTALTFSRVLASSGATQGLINFIIGLNLPVLVLIIFVMIAVLILGAFLDATAIVMIVIPLFMPVVKELGYDPVLFSLLFLINVETGFITPPFGMILFVMKGISSKDTSTKDIWLAAAPFVICNIISIVVLIYIPQIALWLPGFMQY